MGDLFEENLFREKLRHALEEKNFLLKNFFGVETLDASMIAEDYLLYAQKIAPHIADTSMIIDHEIRQGKKVLFEGAQGCHLDIDHGTYP